MNPFTLMKKDHRKVEKIFASLEKAKTKDQKESLFKELKQELDAHAYMEEKAFYPQLKETKETHHLALESFEEHHIVKILLTELAHMDKEQDQWDAKLATLKENVMHHVQEEEDELFPKAEKILGKSVKTIAQNMQEKKQEFLNKV